MTAGTTIEGKEPDYNKMSVTELRQYCRDHGMKIKYLGKLKRADLLKAMEEYEPSKQKPKSRKGTRTNVRNPWINALKAYNEDKAVWIIPKKGSDEYDEVLALMEGMKLTEKSGSRVVDKKEACLNV